MTRPIPEWIGAKPDTVIPPRVNLRAMDRQGGRCANCTRKLGMAGEPVEYDHVVALVNGGENREANVQALCAMCHRAKTDTDVAEKSRVNRKRAKHHGFHKPRNTLPGSRGGKWKAKIGGGWVRRDEE